MRAADYNSHQSGRAGVATRLAHHCRCFDSWQRQWWAIPATGAMGMPYDKVQVEAFAMRAEETSRISGHLGWAVNIHEVGEALGMNADEARNVAVYLQEADWAKCNFSNEPLLVLTPKGREEIAKLRWHPWRRWLHKNISIALSVIAVAISLAALLSKWIFGL